MTSPRFGLSLEELNAELERIFDQVDESFAQTQEPALWDILPHTSLATDDARTAPYNVSHMTRSLIASSVDHLLAVRNLHREAKVSHWAAPFTLVRGALETASTALWLVSAPSRTTRITRCIRLARKDSGDGYTVSGQFNLQRKRTRAEQRDHLTDIGLRAGCDPEALDLGLTSTEIVSAASRQVAGGTLGALGAWRVCSGIAHGRQWAELSFLDREHVSSSADGDLGMYKISAGETQLVWVLNWAFLILRGAGNFYSSRNIPLPETLRGASDRTLVAM